MKQHRIFTAFTALSLGICNLAYAAAAPAEPAEKNVFAAEYLCGDANQDGEINVTDAQLCMRYTAISDKAGFAADNVMSLENADVTGSGEVDMADALTILNYYTLLIGEKDPVWAELIPDDSLTFADRTYLLLEDTGTRYDGSYEKKLVISIAAMPEISAVDLAFSIPDGYEPVLKRDNVVNLRNLQSTDFYCAYYDSSLHQIHYTAMSNKSLDSGAGLFELTLSGCSYYEEYVTISTFSMYDKDGRKIITEDMTAHGIIQPNEELTTTVTTTSMPARYVDIEEDVYVTPGGSTEIYYGGYGEINGYSIEGGKDYFKVLNPWGEGFYGNPDDYYFGESVTLTCASDTPAGNYKLTVGGGVCTIHVYEITTEPPSVTTTTSKATTTTAKAATTTTTAVTMPEASPNVDYYSPFTVYSVYADLTLPETQANIIGGRVECEPGDIVAYPIYLYNTPDSFCATGIAVYTPLNLEYLLDADGQPAAYLSDWANAELMPVLSENLIDDSLILGVGTMGLQKNVSEYGKLWTIFYQVPADAQPGDMFPVGINVREWKDKKLNALPAEGFDGWIKVRGAAETTTTEPERTTTTSTVTTTVTEITSTTTFTSEEFTTEPVMTTTRKAASGSSGGSTTVVVVNGTPLPPALKKYDINSNGALNIADAVLLARIVAEDETLVYLPEYQPDVTEDGFVTVEDVIAVLRAMEPFSLKIGKVTGQPGGIVKIPVRIYADKGTAGGQVYISYDCRLTPVSVTQGDAYSNAVFQSSAESYPLYFAWTTANGLAETAEDGAVLAYLEFEIDPNIPETDYLEVSVVSQAASGYTRFTDADGYTIPASYGSGFITVLP